jgi:hypothetical protein
VTAVAYELCTFGPRAERKRHWILKFEDADIEDMHFDDQDEALSAFGKHSMGYTCTLFSTVSRLLPRDPDDWDHRAM